jgi:hypothetical protein
LTRDEIKSIVSSLFPDDTYKSLRAALYAYPGVMAGQFSKKEIIDIAAKIQNPKEAGSVTVLDPDFTVDQTIAGEVLDPGEFVKQVATRPEPAPPAVVVTAEDYQAANKWFVAISDAIKANEAERVRLKAPILQAEKALDKLYKDRETLMTTELARYSLPMAEFKRKERDDLRKAEADRQESIRQAQIAAQAAADAAKVALEAAHAAEQAVSEQDDEDPFLAALGISGAIEAHVRVIEAQESVREALVEVAMAPVRVSAPVVSAPVKAAGSKARFPWVIEVVDEAKVVRENCSSDSKKLTALKNLLKVQADGDITKVDLNDPRLAGLRLYEDSRIGS